MKLSDIMSAAGLAGYAEVAMVIFLAVFVAIAFRTLSRGRTAEWDEASLVPIREGDDPSERELAHPEDLST